MNAILLLTIKNIAFSTLTLSLGIITPAKVMALSEVNHYSNSNHAYTDVDTYFLRSSIIAGYQPDDNGTSGDGTKGGGAR
ncbi:MAG: hypothetical protein F6K54_26700 [Okeania sp. SIO3B5]|uniref:hypothetical protein n=1 Tax=Okeania sp. SIO3B5 TaxID=2607811 RepID=UPI0013FF750C|nr:hypothetical protein [Okeania sp. SIO3B5]NEO56356.1 hypothetical protein [Okeania sp. SIO3B5]